MKVKISPFMKIKSSFVFSVHDVYGVKILSGLRFNTKFVTVLKIFRLLSA